MYWYVFIRTGKGTVYTYNIYSYIILLYQIIISIRLNEIVFLRSEISKFL